MTTKNSPVTDAMVTRFLSWELPTTFAPDCYVSFDRNAALMHGGWPTGTNLLHAGQAREMLEHVLGAANTAPLPAASPQTKGQCNDERACGACFSDQGNCETSPGYIRLTPSEIQSGSTRVDWAEGLIRQLPADHDGRNSWLLNYGSDKAERQAAWVERNPNSSLARSIYLGEVTGTAPNAPAKIACPFYDKLVSQLRVDLLGNAPDARPTAQEATVSPVETGAEQQPRELVAPEWVEIRKAIAGKGAMDISEVWERCKVEDSTRWERGELVVRDGEALRAVLMGRGCRRADPPSTASEKESFFNPKLGEPYAKPATIKPTIGRKIWYWPSNQDIGRGLMVPMASIASTMLRLDPEQPLDATIVCVNKDGTVNLQILDHIGKPHSRGHVRLVQAGETVGTDVAHCAWMPYQVGQAAKQGGAA